MTQLENAQIARRYIEHVIGQGDTTVAREILDENLIVYTPITQPIRGREAYLAFAASFGTSFENLSVTLDDAFGCGDRAVARFTATGTHTQTFRGAAPTGKKMVIGEVHVLRISNGKIVEDYVADTTPDLARLTV